MRITAMAWRNVWRNTRRSTVTVGAMALSFVATLLLSGLLDGYRAGMERSIVDIDVGDVQIAAPGFRDKPSLYDAITDWQAVLGRLEAAGYPAGARLLGTGLAASDETSAGVQLRGIDVPRDARVSAIYRQIEHGDWVDPADPDGVVIGRRLAKSLEVGLGAQIVLLAQAADGSMANHLYRVRGILRSVSEATDRAGVFMNAAAFRELLVLPVGVHQLIVRRPSRVPLGAATGVVASLAPGLDVQNWRGLMPVFAELLESQKAAINVLFFIVYLAIGIVILNAMLMAVFERIREFGVLKAIGMTPWTVWRLIVCEVSYKVVLAIAAGLVVGVPLLWYMATVGINLGTVAGTSVSGIAWDPIWRAEVSASTFSGPVLLLVLVVAAAVMYPAGKAARLRPVDAIRYR